MSLLNNSIRRILSGLLLIGLFISLFGCSGDGKQRGEALLITPKPYEEGLNNSGSVTEVTYGTVSRNVSGEGSLIYPNTENITCDFFNARLLSVNVRKGDEVKKGDVIAEFLIEYNESDLVVMTSELSISEKQYQAGLISYKDAVSAAENQLTSLTEQYESEPTDMLKAQVAKAKIYLDKAKDSLDFYKYENVRRIDSQKKAIEKFNQNIANNTIYAPFDGIIGNVDYLPAGNIAPYGASICSIYSTETVWIATNSDISNGMRYNAPAEIEISVSDDRLTGRIITAPDLFGSSTGRVVVIPDGPINIDQNDRLRRITVKASRYSLENVLVLPSNNIQNEDGKRFVYLYEDGISKKRYVTLGLSSLNTAQILDGLSAGQLVVSN